MIHIGTSGWSYGDWVSNFYPAGLKQADYLSYYSTKFDTVEIDSTFYSIPKIATVENWYRSVPSGFIFSAKFPKKITHKSDLTGIDEYLNAFLNGISTLKEKLGPLLLQFPYGFKPDMSTNLYKFLKILPSGFNYIIEVRNRKWLGEKFYDSLRENSIGLALIDHPWMPKLQVATSKIVYVRFLGDRNLIPDDFSHERDTRQNELNEWDIILRALREKTDDFYGYFNNHYSGHSPSTARRFIDLISP